MSNEIQSVSLSIFSGAMFLTNQQWVVKEFETNQHVLSFISGNFFLLFLKELHLMICSNGQPFILIVITTP